jgi:hypothetical protein
MTTGSDDPSALRRELRAANARIAALEEQLVAARRLESLGRLTLGKPFSVDALVRKVREVLGLPTD